jgi:hypothetical protein
MYQTSPPTCQVARQVTWQVTCHVPTVNVKRDRVLNPVTARRFLLCGAAETREPVMGRALGFKCWLWLVGVGMFRGRVNGGGNENDG